MDERTQNQLTNEQLAEVEVESDVLDADIEGVEPSPAVAQREEIRPALDPLEVVEAEAEADLLDADLEDV